MPTWELLGDKEKKEYLKDARKATKLLKEECEHSTLGGGCLLHNERCYYEEQTLCSDYTPKYINKIRDKK